jgi:hypothetical protein
MSPVVIARRPRLASRHFSIPARRRCHGGAFAQQPALDPGGMPASQGDGKRSTPRAQRAPTAPGEVGTFLLHAT